jgi:hypothetical protein
MVRRDGCIFISHHHHLDYIVRGRTKGVVEGGLSHPPKYKITRILLEFL